jgi:hypothetical protein
MIKRVARASKSFPFKSIESRRSTLGNIHRIHIPQSTRAIKQIEIDNILRVVCSGE